MISRHTIFLSFSMLVIFTFSNCRYMKVTVVPERYKGATKLYVNGELRGDSAIKIQDFGTYASYDLKGETRNCVVRKKVKSKFNAALCVVNILSYTTAGLSVGLAVGLPANNIGVGMLVGSLVGLAVGGGICPLASWRLPETAIMDMTTCKRNYHRQTRKRRRYRRRRQRRNRAIGCIKDTDCKGDRICEDGQCVYPKR